MASRSEVPQLDFSRISESKTHEASQARRTTQECSTDTASTPTFDTRTTMRLFKACKKWCERTANIHTSEYTLVSTGPTPMVTRALRDTYVFSAHGGWFPKTRSSVAQHFSSESDTDTDGDAPCAPASLDEDSAAADVVLHHEFFQRAMRKSGITVARTAATSYVPMSDARQELNLRCTLSVVRDRGWDTARALCVALMRRLTSSKTRDA